MNLNQACTHAYTYPELYLKVPCHAVGCTNCCKGNVVSVRSMHSVMEQHVNMKFCYKLGRTATEMHEMLVQVYRTDGCYEQKMCLIMVQMLLRWEGNFHD